MGLLNAIKDIGNREASKHPRDEFSDIDSFVEMPADNKAKEIRVWLKVEDFQAEMLKVLEISKIDIVDFWNGNDDDRIKKRRYLYRTPVGANVKWRFSPIYKLGKGCANAKDALLGKGGSWRENSDCRFYKLYNSTLKGFEDKGAFSEGSIDKIMECLEKRVDILAEYWNNRQTSYLLIFSISEDDRHFMYPLEVKAYLTYFRSRLNEQGAKGCGNPQNGDTGEKICSLCHSMASEIVNLDKLFAFATFDKKSFLPGITDKGKNKTFPICNDCFTALSGGKACVDEKFTDSKSIYGVNIYVVPELLMGNAKMSHAVQFNEDFLSKGLSNEGYLSKRIMKMDDSIVLHFVFWEKNQAQERLLLMIEDVPPSRLKQIEYAWSASAKSLGVPDFDDSTSNSHLYMVMGLIRRRIMELAGKSDNEQSYVKDWLLGIEGKMLSGERINVNEIKTFFVSRLQGLCADHEWVQNKSKYFARDASCIIDFLYRLNEEV